MIYNIINVFYNPHPVLKRHVASFSPSGSLALAPTIRPCYATCSRIYLCIYIYLYYIHLDLSILISICHILDRVNLLGGTFITELVSRVGADNSAKIYLSIYLSIHPYLSHYIYIHILLTPRRWKIYYWMGFARWRWRFGRAAQRAVVACAYIYYIINVPPAIV